MAHRTNRRKFLKTTAVVGAGYFAASGLRAQESNSPNEQVNIASIGVGGKGDSDSRDAGTQGNLVAICDIDNNNLRKKGIAFPKARQYRDYRKMLDEYGKNIDAVTVSTPDHSHAPASLMAMRLGKHCFTQKPMTHSIEEAHLMGEVAREMKLKTQMGNQGTSYDSLREMVAVIQKGTLGAVSEVHVWTNRPVWPQGDKVDLSNPAPIPSHVDWDLFLGPAEKRPYHQAIHPFKWRGFWSFGTGALGDMACHTLNMPFMALELYDPTSVQAETNGHDGQTYPGFSIIDFAFPAKGDRPAVKLVWYDGGKLPPKELFHGAKIQNRGALIIGDKGSLYAPGDYAEKGMTLHGVDKPDVEWVKSPGHFTEWIRSIKGGDAAVSNFADYAGPLTETILLGNLALAGATEPGKGKKIAWDSKKLIATNAPEVMHIVKKEYHNGFKI
ncbi:MAG: Gfo/Idh/MocA family oxidoreductase [Pirellulaceae bacterium]|nr:Gfo/Idh/MocA family oxidoreductase [Pirellulaceae bacterium]HJN13267.1 Gfo/Idh/MocA family oxidoreductase [Pirellulaceae bacterium]